MFYFFKQHQQAKKYACGNLDIRKHKNLLKWKISNSFKRSPKKKYIFSFLSGFNEIKVLRNVISY